MNDLTQPPSTDAHRCKWFKRPLEDGVAFSEVDKEEKETIAHGRKAAEVPASSEEWCGLAFSGGGIRSATFNLGILQGLARHGLLKQFDYLSTASGGGYIGSWLTAWIHQRNQQDLPGLPGFKEVNEALQASAIASASGESNPSDKGEAKEPPEIHWLRRYSNYLTPKVGPTSLDTLWGIVTYLRNLLINWAVFIPSVAFGALLVVLFAMLLNAFAVHCPFGVGMVALVVASSAFGIGLAPLLVIRPETRTQETCFHWVPWAIALALIVTGGTIGPALLLGDAPISGLVEIMVVVSYTGAVLVADCWWSGAKRKERPQTHCLMNRLKNYLMKKAVIVQTLMAAALLSCGVLQGNRAIPLPALR
ncbi:MAG: patatin-like phospholipase family protein [Pseudomonadales bacterium]|nr:patatin-like phospholipase family protein [Pseudomonadales bacterium]